MILPDALKASQHDRALLFAEDGRIYVAFHTGLVTGLEPSGQPFQPAESLLAQMRQATSWEPLP